MAFSFLFILCRGNHYVKIIVTIPVDITARQKELMEMFAAERVLEENRRSGKGSGSSNEKQKYKTDYDIYDDDSQGVSAR